MIEVPVQICDAVFDNNFIRGAVIKTVIKFHSGEERYKYLIILNHNINKDPKVFVLTTSQLDFFIKYPSFNPEIVRVSANVLPFFVKDTVIDCREISSMSGEKLKCNFRDGILQFVGILPETYLQQIDGIIKNSRLISLNEKILVLGKGV